MAYEYSNGNKKERIRQGILRFFRKIKDLKSSVKRKKGLSEYTEPKPTGFNKTSTKLPIKKIGIIVVLILVALTVGFGISGMVSHMETLETELNSTQVQLQNTKKEKENCKENLVSCAEQKSSLQGNLSSTESLLGTCQYELDITNETLVETNETLDECLTNQSLLEQDVDELEDNYEELVKNTVPDYCCGAGETNVTKNWDLDTGNNQINCNTGSYTIDCSNDQISGYP